MATSVRTRTGFIFFSCIILGGVAGFVFVDVAELLRKRLADIPNLRQDYSALLASLEPSLARVLIGTVFFGMSAYLLCRFTLGSFARGLLNELTRMMRAKNVLPYSFKYAKKQKLRYVGENLISIFDIYVTKLHEADTERTKFQEALEKYADPTVAGRLKYQENLVTIASARRKVAVLFADIRGFTPMTESLLPEEVVMILNEHFAACNYAITKYHGKINKFIGDAVMAIFEEPPAYKQDESAARNACNAALEMCDRFQDNAKSWAARVSKSVTFGLGVGVHTGTVILGNIGSEERMEYTAIGDTVNLSSRLCSLAKPGQVLVSEECFEQIQLFFNGAAQEPQKIKGKTGLYTTYAVGRMIEH